VIGDATNTLQALIQSSRRKRAGCRKNQVLLDEIKAGKEEFLAKYRPLLESHEKPMNPYRVYGDLMKILDPKSSFVTGDSGNTRDQISTVYEAQIPHGFLGWGNVSTLGFSLAAAVGAKLAYPDRQCINITGDAGVSYMMGNFEALTRYGIASPPFISTTVASRAMALDFGGGHDPIPMRSPITKGPAWPPRLERRALPEDVTSHRRSFLRCGV
jgi:thiamine pyrophosphate-dependent acetolactate synthase large subunit-like protein